MAMNRKKVIVRRFTSGYLSGYLPSSGLLADSAPGTLDILDLQANVQAVPLGDVKYVAYVRDFSTTDSDQPERLLRKVFTGRPRSEGLWLRLTLRDDDQMEGLAALDLAFVDGWIADGGVHLTPADIRGNTQRIFVPRGSISALEILAVVTTPTRKLPSQRASQAEQQPDLFSFPVPDSRPN